MSWGVSETCCCENAVVWGGMDIRKVMTARSVYGIAEIHCERHGFPTESTLDEGVSNPQAIQLVACCDPKTVEAKHSAK